ncbi:MAG: C25 family cysteine peptidase, partial [Candidatus Poribacteria bacterium]
MILTDAERLRSALGSDAERVELAMYGFAARHGATIVDGADVVGSQGRELFTYPSAATSEAARAIHGLAAAYRPAYVVIVGDERVVPTHGVDVGGGEFTTDYFYGSHTEDGLPDAPVTRVLGSLASMTRQLSESPGAYDGGDTSRRALFLCSEDTRVHLETRAFLQTLQEIGYAPTFTMEPAAEEAPHYDAVIHFGHGSDTALSGRWQTYVTADEIPALPRGPIAFVDGCATTPVGSPLVRAFLNQGGTAYIGSSSDVYAMIPARHACELVLYFLKRLAAQDREPIGESLRRAHLDCIRAHPQLRDRLREACCTGRCSTPADATDTETVLQWQQYGAPLATLSGSAVEPVFQSHRMLNSPVRLGAGDTLALQAPGTPDGRIPVLSLEGVWLDKITEGVR